MRRRYRLVVAGALLAVLAACEDSSSGNPPIECFSIDDCEADAICFLGNCVDPGFAINTVYAEVTPPNDSPYLAQQLPSPLQLSNGFQEISLRSSVRFSGKVLVNGSPAGSSSETGMLQAKFEGSIPGRPVTRYASVSSSGFDLDVLPARYDVVFVPDLGNPPRPPIEYLQVDVSQRLDREFPYPADGTLVTVRGQVRSTIDLTSKVEGAQIVGTARDGQGNELRSTAASTDSSGEYALAFPPGAQVFDIEVSPGSNPLVPKAVFTGLTIVTAPDRLPDIILGVEQEVTVTARVLNESGNLVPDATVLFQGQVGSGSFQAIGTSNATGSVQKDLLPGDYTVIVAPQQAQPYAISATEMTIPAAQSTVDLTVRNKVRLQGFVSSHSGESVSGATVTLTQRGLPPETQRRFTAVTGPDGWYRVDVDPGTQVAPAEYELTIETDRQSGLPWYRELLTIAAQDLRHDIHLYPPSFAYGRVRDPGGTPLANVIIAFYSKDLGSTGEEQPLLVGVVQTSEGGEFVLPVPTPTTP